MRHWTIFLSLALVVGLVLGCDRKPPPEKPTVWDRDLDGEGPPIYAVEIDSRIIADQNKVSKQAVDDAARAAMATRPPTGPPASGAEAEVKAAIAAMVRGFETSDGDAVARVVDAPPEAMDFIKRLVPPMAKMLAFDRAGVQAYGKAAWDAAKPAGEMGSTSLPTVADIQTKAKVQILGDTATATMEGEPKPVSIVKKGGVWLVKPDFPVPADTAQQDQVIKLMTAMAAALDGPRQKIGQAGVTAKQIREEAQKAMAALLGAGT